MHDYKQPVSLWIFLMQWQVLTNLFALKNIQKKKGEREKKSFYICNSLIFLILFYMQSLPIP
jgi:hypothetical protein